MSLDREDEEGPVALVETPMKLNILFLVLAAIIPAAVAYFVQPPLVVCAIGGALFGVVAGFLWRFLVSQERE